MNKKQCQIIISHKRNGVKSIISKANKASVDILVEAGDRIQFGDLYLEVRATPGQTVGCVTYVTGDGPDQPQPRVAFTGDALLIRGCGRMDFQVYKSGPLFLSSKGIGWTSWKKRWFILTETSLVFFRSDPNAASQKGGEANLTLGGIDLNSSGSLVVKVDKKLLTVSFLDGRDGRAFTLKVGGRVDAYTNVDIDGIREKWASYAVTFIFK